MNVFDFQKKIFSNFFFRLFFFPGKSTSEKTAAADPAWVS
jgi:hypothetical protein